MDLSLIYKLVRAVALEAYRIATMSRWQLQQTRYYSKSCTWLAHQPEKVVRQQL